MNQFYDIDKELIETEKELADLDVARDVLQKKVNYLRLKPICVNLRG